MPGINIWKLDSRLYASIYPLQPTPLPHFTKSLGLLPKPLRLQAKSLAHQPKTLGPEPNRLASEPKILAFWPKRFSKQPQRFRKTKENSPRKPQAVFFKLKSFTLLLQDRFPGVCRFGERTASAHSSSFRSPGHWSPLCNWCRHNRPAPPCSCRNRAEFSSSSAFRLTQLRDALYFR